MSIKKPIRYFIGALLVVLFRFTMLESLMRSSSGSLYDRLGSANQLVKVQVTMDIIAAVLVMIGIIYLIKAAKNK